MIWVALLLACSGARPEVVESPIQVTVGPLGPAHGATGTPYQVVGEPRVEAGMLQVQVLQGPECTERAFHLQVDRITHQEPATAMTSLFLVGPPEACPGEEPELVQFPLAEALPPGCYERLVLKVDGRSPVVLPLENLGCEQAARGGAEAGDLALLEGEQRWGDPYRVLGQPRLEQGVLHVTTRFRGGCADHAWDVVFRAWHDGRVPTAVADLVHDARGDRCRFVETEQVRIDLRPWLRERCPKLLELRVPGVLSTGEVVDRSVLLRLEDDLCR